MISISHKVVELPNTSPQPQVNNHPMTSSLEYIFEKKTKYNKTPEWTLPPHEELFTELYQFENFQQLKKDLNNVKSKLNDYNIEDWSAHTRRQDPCGAIPWKIKQEIGAEFVTVAWCKFFECLHRFEIVKDGNLNSLHLCEAPGAFIAALNHYLHSTFEEVNFNWLATTLNPYYEGNPLNKMIIDVRFMLHTLKNWIFYKDFSGNIMLRENIEYMARECERRLGTVHLITADGSVDCKETPDNQEEYVSALHFSEMCAALLILAEGGSFVLKMFTLFEALSVSVMYLLNCVFEEVSVFKPATSKRGNSEVYVICVNYKRPSNIGDYLNVMLDAIGTQNLLPLFPKRRIPADFCLQHQVCCRRFMFEQMNGIESNIYAYRVQNRWENKKLNDTKHLVCEMFFEKYRLRPLPADKKILQSAVNQIQYGERCSRQIQGSFTERRSQKELSHDEKVFLFCKTLNDIEKSIIWVYDEMASFQRSPDESVPMELVKGKPIDKILSSLFVFVDILELRAEVESLFEVDPIFQDIPRCELGDGGNPSSWSITVENGLSENIAGEQRKFFTKILEIIREHQPTRVNFVNFPFLTHYSVSILRYLSGNVYDTCRMAGGREVTLEIKEFGEEAKRSLADLHDAVSANEDAWSFVDIPQLHRNKFSKTLIEFNNQLLLHNYKTVLSGR